VAEQQQDLLGDSSYNAGLLEHLENLPPEAREKWPKDFAALCDIYETELAAMALEPEQARHISLRLLLALASYGGGRIFYLPKADRLRQAIRDRQIWQEFKGHNHEALAKKYNLTVPRIYAIVREQVALHRANVQPKLPF
jgi:Mor family transcriptional regulator